MDVSLIKELFEVCIFPLLGVLTAYFIKWVNVKSAELVTKTNNENQTKYINIII